VSDLFNDMIRICCSQIPKLPSIPRSSDNRFLTQQGMPPTTPETTMNQQPHTSDTTTPSSQSSSMRSSAQHQQCARTKTQAFTYQNPTPSANSPEKHLCFLTTTTMIKRITAHHSQRRCSRSAQCNRRTNLIEQTPYSQSFGSCSWSSNSMMSCWGSSYKTSQTSKWSSKCGTRCSRFNSRSVAAVVVRLSLDAIRWPVSPKSRNSPSNKQVKIKLCNRMTMASSRSRIVKGANVRMIVWSGRHGWMSWVRRSCCVRMMMMIRSVSDNRTSRVKIRWPKKHWGCNISKCSARYKRMFQRRSRALTITVSCRIGLLYRQPSTSNS
jgi:hypothetical protein